MKRTPLVPATALVSLGFLLSACGSQTSTPAADAKVTAQRLLCVDPTDPACQNPGTPPSNPPTIPPTPTLARQFFEISMNELKANVVTDGPGNVDEVYMEVAARDGSGNSGYVRLPRRSDGSDDYYRFGAGQDSTADAPNTWVNKDAGFVGRPMFYVGSLAPGENMQLLVRLKEQDNTTFSGLAPFETYLVSTLNLIAAYFGGQGQNWPSAIFSAAATLAGYLPANSADDLLGAFTVTVTNNNGVLTKTWAPIPSIYNDRGTATTTMDQQSGLIASTAPAETHTLELSGTSNGNYNGAVTFQTVTNAQTYEDRPLSYISRDEDACSSDNLTVNGVQLPKNDPYGPKGMDVTLQHESSWFTSGDYFHWNCDGSDERTKPDPATTYVIASHRGGSDNRQIYWYEFKKVNQ